MRAGDPMKDRPLVTVLNRARRPVRREVEMRASLSPIEKACAICLTIAMVLLLSLAGGMFFGAGGC